MMRMMEEANSASQRPLLISDLLGVPPPAAQNIVRFVRGNQKRQLLLSVQFSADERSEIKPQIMWQEVEHADKTRLQDFLLSL